MVMLLRSVMRIPPAALSDPRHRLRQLAPGVGEAFAQWGASVRGPAVPAGADNLFERIAAGGFNDGQNGYAHSMAWYRGYLYVGTTRNNLCLIKSNPKRDTMRP